MSELKLESDYRQRAATSEVNGNIAISYDIKQKTDQPVESVVGSINKNGSRIGAVSLDIKNNSMYVSFEKFDIITSEEREAILIKVNQDVEPLLKL